VFSIAHPTNSNHNGGQLQFGPDGMLYAGTGDGGSANDPPNNAQNPSSLLGKMLRIDPLSGATTPEIYALGLRNPFRFSFDRQTGDLVIGDVGQNNWEEVDFSPAGTAPGRNYGWRCREGMHANPNLSSPCTVPGAIDPVLEKDHSTTNYRAIIGGYVVRDPALSGLTGRYVYGDNNESRIHSVTLPGATDDAATGLTVSHTTSFGEDSCGHVYVASGDGPVYRIDGDTFTPCPEQTGPTPGPTPTPTPVPTPPGDKTPPTLRLDARARQHALRLHGFRVAIASDEQCTAAVSGTVRIAGSKHAYTLSSAMPQIDTGGRVKVTLRASSRTLRAIRTALRHHRAVTATLTVTGRDIAGNQSSGVRRIRAVR
jgi:hypothetical protein